MTDPTSAPQIRHLSTAELTDVETASIRALLEEAFAEVEDPGFSDDDWQHALGGTHVLLDVGGEIVAHAAVVQRDLQIGGVPIRTGYVEAVAVEPQRQGRGDGTAVMDAIAEIIQAHYELGALGTGSHHFYERMGWRVWQGPSFVRTADGDRATLDEDGYILVLTTPRTPPFDPHAPLSCEWREGDVW